MTAESASVVCSIAGPDDAQDICALLRENPMDGAFALALTRDPDPFALSALAERSAFVIARDRTTGEAVGLCERVVRECIVGGRPQLAPYLNALRVARSHRGRIGILRAGFAALRETERPDEAAFALTSIAKGNRAAERVLTAGLRGLPVYRPLGDLSTFALRPRRARRDPRIAPATRVCLGELAAFLNARNAGRDFAPVWTEARLAALTAFGLPPERILLLRGGGAIRGSIALWDQRTFRQTRVLRYPRALGAIRPLVNLAAPLLRLPALAPPGAPLGQATCALLGAADDDPEIFRAMLDAALEEARRGGFSVFALALPSDSPWRSALSTRRALEYVATLHIVAWPDARFDAPDGRPLAPELGFL